MAAVDNQRRAVRAADGTSGDRFRLYKKTSATIDGTRGFIGANGDMVEVVQPDG